MRQRRQVATEFQDVTLLFKHGRHESQQMLSALNAAELILRCPTD